MTTYSDADLLAYLDGAVPPDEAQQMAAQIEISAELRARLSALTRQQAALRARLFRADCPDPHRLGDYHLGLLPADQAGLIRQHVARCPHCADELRHLQAFLAPGLAEKARVIIATLLSGGAAVGLRPALGLRGGAPGPLVYAAGELQIILEFQPELRRPERRSLTGLLTGSLPAAVEAQLRAAAVLRPAAQPQAADQPPLAAPIGELGEFVFTDLAPGSYVLSLTAPDLEIRFPPFEIS